MPQEQDKQSNGLTVIDGGKAALETEKQAGVVGSRAWATRIRRRAKELTGILETGYMELARILHQVWDTPVDGDRKKPAVYTAWGYESFKEYAAKELDLHPKKAERLRLMWHILEVELRDLDPEIKQRIVDLKYAKVRELVRVLTMRNAKSWVERAEKMSYFALQAAVTDEVRRIGGRVKQIEAAEEAGEEPAGPPPELPPGMALDEPLTRETFGLYPEQLKNVRKALDVARRVSGSDVKSNNLDLICTSFLANTDVVAGENDPRPRLLAQIERQLGVRIVAFDGDDAGDIIFGVDTLQKIGGSEESSGG
jgi:hypothetical protein